MEEIDKQATERVLKARSELILARRFYGVLVSNVEPVLSRKFPTMATNGRQHFFNPDYIMRQTPQKILGVQAHESEHDARHHGTRRGNRDPLKWNEACDYAINGDLIREGFELPEGVLIDPRFDGMSAEDIYRIRELDEQREQEQQSQSEPNDDGDAEPEQGNGSGDDQSDEQENDDDTQGDEPSEPSDDGDEDEGEDGDADGEPEDEQSEGDGEGESTAENSAVEEEGEGEGGSGGDEPAEGDDTTSDGGGGGEPTDDADGEAESEPQSSGDPGGCGEVLDSADDASDVADIDQQWERIVRQAASMAKAVGQLPGHVSRDIERANNPERDWREELRAWFDQGSLQLETWGRPNRRFIGAGLYLPGKRRDGINRAAFLIDTSGSMDTIALGLIRNETQVALDDGVIDEVIVIYGDTQVTRTDVYKTGDEIEFDPRGGGGTRLRPLFEHVRDNFDDVSLIVCFTDMENYDWGDEPACPVLFAATGYPDRVRQYLASAPWGAPGIDVGAH